MALPLLLLFFTWCHSSGADEARTLTVGNTERTFRLHRPPTWKRGNPLVLVFHGGTGTAKGAEKIVRFLHASDPEGWLVAFPQGLDKKWEDGRLTETPTAVDLDFFDALVAKLTEEFGVPPGKVFATGISNGGGFSFRLACERASALGAIAAVAMNLAENMRDRCRPSRPVPVLHITGDKDNLVPVDGGFVTGPLGIKRRGKVISAQETLGFWKEKNGCHGKPAVETWDRDPKDGTHVTATVYAPCGGDSRVEQILIHGGGHTWPMGGQYLPKLLVGKISRELDGSKHIVEFFKSVGR